MVISCTRHGQSNIRPSWVQRVGVDGKLLENHVQSKSICAQNACGEGNESVEGASEGDGSRIMEVCITKDNNLIQMYTSQHSI